MKSESAIFQALRVYQKEYSYRTMFEDLKLYSVNDGVIHITRDSMIIARPVHIDPLWQYMRKPLPKNDQTQAIADPLTTYDKSTWNCWHIGLWVGNLSKLFTLSPFELPYVSFQKRNGLKVYTIAQMKERVLCKNTSP